MSTELFEAKQIVDEIHHAAGVPQKKNPDIYNMTLAHIGALILEMDRKGKPMSEQRTLMGAKKDELIRELISLRQDGVLRGESEAPNKKAPKITVRRDQIQIARAH